MEFKNTYIIAIIVVLLFGVGLGYQISSWVNDGEDAETTEVVTSVNTTVSQAGTSPQEAPEVYSRTGKVTVITSDAVTFEVNTQNSDSTFTKSTLVASVPSGTAVTKVNLRDTVKTVTTITMSDIAVGNEVEVKSDENIYGKTSFTASSVQLHEF